MASTRAAPAFSLSVSTSPRTTIPAKPSLRVRVFRQYLHICLKTCNESLVLLNLFREVAENVVLQTILLALMIGLHQLQPCHVHIQIHLLLDPLITGTECLDFRIGKRSLINVLTTSYGAFAWS